MNTAQIIASPSGSGAIAVAPGSGFRPAGFGETSFMHTMLSVLSQEASGVTAAAAGGQTSNPGTAASTAANPAANVLNLLHHSAAASASTTSATFSQPSYGMNGSGSGLQQFLQGLISDLGGAATGALI